MLHISAIARIPMHLACLPNYGYLQASAVTSHTRSPAFQT